jgi:S1-C subfamily serine protease
MAEPFDSAFDSFETVKARVGGLGDVNAHFPKDSQLASEVRQARETSAKITVTRPDGTEQPLGSGFVATPDGKVITDRHVIEDNENDKLSLYINGHRYEGEVIKNDPATDLAVVQIAGAEHMASLELGDSTTLKPGQAATGYGFGNSWDLKMIPGTANRIGPQNELTPNAQALSHEDISRPMIELNMAEGNPSDAMKGTGNSGGPIVVRGSDGIARGVGIIDYRMGATALRLSYSTPSEAALSVLKDTPLGSQTLRTFEFANRQLYPATRVELYNHTKFELSPNARIGNKPLYDDRNLHPKRK